MVGKVKKKKKQRTGAKLRNLRMTMSGWQCEKLEIAVCLITRNFMGWKGVATLHLNLASLLSYFISMNYTKIFVIVSFPAFFKNLELN